MSATTMRTPRLAFPRAPVLDWSSFREEAAQGSSLTLPSVQDLDNVAYTTSGRAAIYQALLQLALPQGSQVLIPTYHCPTMVAPVLLAGLRPMYFGLRPDGLPDLAALNQRDLGDVGAIVVVHYFGLSQSLAAVRLWCDDRAIALIEDCAHCFFGDAGERAVGAWGDYATASLSKFFPVPEAGLLGSAQRVINGMSLRPPSLKSQIKGCVDVLEFAAQHDRLGGLRTALAGIFALKNHRSKAADDHVPDDQVANSMMLGCDMARVSDAPLWASMVLNDLLPRHRTLRRRRENFALYHEAFSRVEGARPLFDGSSEAAAPYVYPLWVDDSDRVYQAVRALGLPVFRWERIWQGTPTLPGDVGPSWSRHVLQLLCHQDLRPNDITCTAEAILSLLPQSAASAAVAGTSSAHHSSAGMAPR